MITTLFKVISIYTINVKMHDKLPLPLLSLSLRPPAENPEQLGSNTSHRYIALSPHHCDLGKNPQTACADRQTDRPKKMQGALGCPFPLGYILCTSLSYDMFYDKRGITPLVC